MSVERASGIEHAYRFLAERGAADKPHSGRTLLVHLTRTWRLLRDWGNPQPVCMAGLFHSVYGTNAFRHATVDQAERGAVQGLIGAEAEALAHAFCSIERPRAILRTATLAERGGPEVLCVDHRHGGEAIAVTREQLAQLAEIEVANLVEQGSRVRHLREFFFLGLSSGPWLSPMATAALKDALKSGLRAGTGAPAAAELRA